MIDEFLRRHPGPLTPQAVKDLKQSAQAIAKPIYRAQAAGNVVPADQALTRRFNESIASGSNTALEKIPGVGPQEARTQELIGASKSIKRAEQRRNPVSKTKAGGVRKRKVGAGPKGLLASMEQKL